MDRAIGVEPFEWPITVDEAMLNTLVARLLIANPRAQLLLGAAGLGKSTMAFAAASALEARGFVVLPVIALAELATVPLAAMAPVLARLRTDSSDILGQRLQQLFTVIASNADGYVLVVDDAPDLDSVSASMIYQLVRATGVRCILTARSDRELTGPVARLLAEGRIDQTTMPGLAPDTAGRLVYAVLGQSVDPQSLRRLVTVADGNPLFLRELVIGAIERQAITVGPRGLLIDHASLPARLSEGIRSHFDTLREDLRELVDLIAVAEPWPESMLGQPSLLAELTDRGLVRRSFDGEIYLAHPLFAETLLAGMSAERLDARRRAAAARFVVTGDDSRRFKVAVLLAETTTPPAAAELAWAARYAYSVTDQALAVRLADSSIAAARSFDALLVRAAALSAMKDAAADEAFTNADRAAQSDIERALVAREWSEHHAIRLQNPRAAIERELVILESMADVAARTLLEADIGRWRLMIGEAPLLEPRSLTVMDDDPMAALNAATYEVMYAAQAGRFAQARAALARARPLADRVRLTVPSAGGVLDLFEFRVLLYENGIAAGEAYARERQRDDFNDAVGIWSYAMASLAMHSGRVVEADEFAEYAIEQLLWRDFSGLLGTAVALRASIAAQLGSPALAHELLATRSTGDVKEMLQRVEVEAWLLVAAGDRGAAAAALRAAGVRAIEMHANALAAPTLYLAVRLGKAAVVIEQLRTIAATAEGVFIHSMVGHAEAAVARDAEALLAAAGQLAEVGLLAGAVDAAGQAAALFRSVGRAERERRASILIAKWDVGLSGFRAARDERGSLDLTEREWAVARAAANRRRSKEIAEQLGVSARTVDNHLTNIYRKLGVAGRDELRAEIERLD
ncbi:MAG: hypothetical protein JWN80_783 [Microbacteriaceae bacterium]|nr:hypothetical protein [Microbacteriaceae bacterium]